MNFRTSFSNVSCYMPLEDHAIAVFLATCQFSSQLQRHPPLSESVQVTNPPIDPLREGLVMSLNMRLGKRGNLLQPSADAYSQVEGLLPCMLACISSAKARHSCLEMMHHIPIHGGPYDISVVRCMHCLIDPKLHHAACCGRHIQDPGLQASSAASSWKCVK